ncbi:DedA family protein [Enemella evansiae]|uniref:DedA family protein n=1 Tax=Enemella evansiae TaxID=2016499 RepID=UPI003983A02D
MPGQSIAVASSALAAARYLDSRMVAIVIFWGAYVGCVIGYGIGAWFGSRRPDWHPHGRIGRWWLYACDSAGRHPARTILLGRWSAVLRACVPNACGMARVGVIRFLVWNVVACALWTAAVVTVGVAFHGAASSLGESVLGTFSGLVLVIVLVILIAGYRSRTESLLATRVQQVPSDNGKEVS